MLHNAYLLAKIGADTAENERNFAEILPKISKIRKCSGAERSAVQKASSTVFLPGGSVHGERANFTRLLLGCTEATICKLILDGIAICWKALAEIYTMHSFAPFSNLIF